jgi:flagellar hook-basal body complex protein FliE
VIDRVGGGSGFRPLTETIPRGAPAATEGPAFTEKLSEALGQVEGTLGGAEDALTELASGQNVDLHGTMIALEKADIALRMTVSARDKFIAAYEQIMNMAL